MHGCGKTAWVLRLIYNVRQKIEPVPSRIWYYYGEHQPVFNNYPQVHFEEGLASRVSRLGSAALLRLQSRKSYATATI